MVRVLLGLGLFAVLFGTFALAETLTHEEGHMSAARYREVTLLHAIVPACFLAISGLAVARRGNAVAALPGLVHDESARAATTLARPWLSPLLLGAVSLRVLRERLCFRYSFRAMLYLVVPPLAWVGAAIVERGVEQFF